MLLKALRDLISEGMACGNINPLLDQEVSEFIVEVTDKKRLRRLKNLRQELDKFIVEISTQNELLDQEYKLSEKQRIKSIENAQKYAELVNSGAQ